VASETNLASDIWSVAVSENGVLYIKTFGKEIILMQYPAGKTDSTFVIPNSITKIEDLTFHGCRNLTSVTIPNSIKIIGAETFSGSGITNITIPNSVTEIGNLAFFSCPSLTSVTFEGTIASGKFGDNNSAFSGDLVEKYLAGGIGTYTRLNTTSTTWTKQN